MRGWRYPLEPLRKRRQWQLDAALAQASQLRQGLIASQARLARLDEEAKAQSAQANVAWQNHRDPIMHTRLLGYLAAQHARGAAIHGEIELLRQQINSAQQEVLQRHHALEALHRHHKEAMDQERRQQGRGQQAQADQHWIAQSHLRQGQAR